MPRSSRKFRNTMRTLATFSMFQFPAVAIPIVGPWADIFINAAEDITAIFSFFSNLPKPQRDYSMMHEQIALLVFIFLSSTQVVLLTYLFFTNMSCPIVSMDSSTNSTSEPTNSVTDLSTLCKVTYILAGFKAALKVVAMAGSEFKKRPVEVEIQAQTAVAAHARQRQTFGLFGPARPHPVAVPVPVPFPPHEAPFHTVMAPP